MSEAADNGRITFTVKELLAKVDAKLDVIVSQLDSKAEGHELDRLAERVTVLEGSAATEASLAKERKARADERKRDRRWTLGFAASTLIGVLGLAAALIFDLIQKT